MPDPRDLDEPFSLHPLTGEDVLKHLLSADDEADEPEDEEATD